MRLLLFLLAFFLCVLLSLARRRWFRCCGGGIYHASWDYLIRDKYLLRFDLPLAQQDNLWPEFNNGEDMLLTDSNYGNCLTAERDTELNDLLVTLKPCKGGKDQIWNSIGSVEKCWFPFSLDCTDTCLKQSGRDICELTEYEYEPFELLPFSRSIRQIRATYFKNDCLEMSADLKLRLRKCIHYGENESQLWSFNRTADFWIPTWRNVMYDQCIKERNGEIIIGDCASDEEVAKRYANKTLSEHELGVSFNYKDNIISSSEIYAGNVFNFLFPPERVVTFEDGKKLCMDLAENKPISRYFEYEFLGDWNLSDPYYSDDENVPYYYLYSKFPYPYYNYYAEYEYEDELGRKFPFVLTESCTKKRSQQFIVIPEFLKYTGIYSLDGFLRLVNLESGIFYKFLLWDVYGKGTFHHGSIGDSGSGQIMYYRSKDCYSTGSRTECELDFRSYGRVFENNDHIVPVYAQSFEFEETPKDELLQTSCGFSCPLNSSPLDVCVSGIHQCACRSGFKMDNGQCVCKHGYYMKKGDCISCNTCPENSVNKTSCVKSSKRDCKCVDGFEMRKGNCENCITFTCPENSVAKKSCVKKLAHCECLAGFEMKEGTCDNCTTFACPQNSVAKKSCVKKPKHCKCKDGFKMKKGKCEEKS